MDELTKKELWRDAIGWVKVVVGALVFAWIFVNCVIVNATVPTGSMEDTIRINDRIIAFRLSYLFSQPQRYDIIVYRSPYIRNRLYVKRIIGVPGDVVTIVDGRVYINGEDEPLRDDFVRGELFGNYGPFPDEGVIPAGSFFVLGDNRNNSVDSRSPTWSDPFVTSDQILGRVLFRYFPRIQRLR